MIVIVGAGLIGLGIAYELACRGARVRVVDSREPGTGASWAGAGMLAPHTEAIASQSLAALCADSLARYPTFVERLARDGDVDTRLRLDGLVEAAFDSAAETRLHHRAAELVAREIPVRYLERDEIRALEPALGTSVRGGLLSQSEGHVDNRRLGRALRAACARQGVVVEELAGSVALESDSRRVLGIRRTAGFLPAETVVNAAGAWAAELAGVPAHASVPVLPVKGQMLALATPTGLVRRVLWAPGVYFVPRDDGRLLVGATVEHAGFDTRVTASGLRTLLDAALAAAPALGNFAVAETWAGLRPGTLDGLPYLGRSSLSGYVVATGHYRNGILLMPATAVAIADMLEGKAGAAETLAPFSPLRPRSTAQDDAVA